MRAITPQDVALLAWTLLPGIGSRRFRQFLNCLGREGMVEIWQDPQALRMLLDLPGVHLEEAPSYYWRWAEDLLDQATAQGIEWVFWGEKAYPPGLEGLDSAPPVLFYKGNLAGLSAFSVGVVGTRRPTLYGKTQAHRFVEVLVASGVGIISGGARGIDGEAHKTALEAGGFTAAVLGTGLDVPYPRHLEKLRKRIVEEGGVLLSEFVPGTEPHRENFPRRNRLISALSRGILVVEAPQQSGALNTARWAVDQGKEVFVIPGPVHYPSFAGNHHLLREGARLVASPEEMLEDLGLESGPPSRLAPLTEPEQQLLEDWPVGEDFQVEDLCEHLGWPPSRLLPLLLQLEMKGRIRQLPGKRFVRVV